MSYDIYLLDPRAWEHRQEGCPQEEREYNGHKFMDVAMDHRCPGHTVEIGNITYNISPMWAEALGMGDGITTDHDAISRIMGFDGARERPYGIFRFQDAPCVEAAGPLAEAVERMKNHPEHYRAMNPENGWGSYEGALAYLERLATECATYPEYRIRIS